MAVETLPNVRHVLRLDQEEFAILRQAVQRLKGKAQFLVHPFYMDHRTYEFKADKQIREFETYKTNRSHLLSACAENGIPLFILEQFDSYESLGDKLSFSATAYGISTGTETFLPLGGFESWDQMAGVIRSVGVTHLFVGGTRMILMQMKEGAGDLGIDRRNLDPLKLLLNKNCLGLKSLVDLNLGLAGCAGTAAKLLPLAGFDVSISPVSFPHTLRNYSRI